MINSEILDQSDAYREQFTQARPFRHILLENFLTNETASELLAQFPAFANENAMNEFGEVGGKAVVTDLDAISPAYNAIYHYFNSAEFLRIVSGITGIPELLPDPQLYGGGTHENVEGQELDPHVDYNYINGGKLHRRLNLLIYFNKEWKQEWGGAIELHSNPRRPEQNRVTSYLPLFNHALIFETSEHSWHGFEKIRLPENKKHLTRKSLAIYLYTRTRPADEIAPPHSTFYVQRPLPGHINVGHTLTAESLQEVKNLLRRRDDWIDFYQRKELEDSQTIQQLRAQVDNNMSSGFSLSPGHLARVIYYRLPVSDSNKHKIKSFFFTCFGFALRKREVYKNWREGKDRNFNKD